MESNNMVQQPIGTFGKVSTIEEEPCTPSKVGGNSPSGQYSAKMP